MVSSFIAILSFTGNSLAAAGTSNEPKIGEHFKVIPGAYGTNEITLVANGLNYQDTNGNWIESIPIVQSFSSAIVCTGASYRVILATNLNSYGSVDMELPADPATGTRGRMVSHPLGIAFYDPDSGGSVLLAQLKDCSAQIVSNKVIFADAFVGSNGIEGSVTYTYDVGHFHQDIMLTAKPSVTPADFGMGANARLEMLTEIVQSPAPVITEKAMSTGTRSATSAMTAQSATEPAVTDQTLNYGTMQMGMGRAFSTPTTPSTASPQSALPVIKRLVSIDSRAVLTEDVLWNKAAEALQNLPQSSGGASAAPPSAKRTLPRRKMLAQMTVPSPRPGKMRPFNERLAEASRLPLPKIASLNSQLLGASKRSDGGSALNLPPGFVMDYEIVQTCNDYTFQSDHTYFINSSVVMWYATIQSGAVIKLSSSGNLRPTVAINCPDYEQKAVITDMNDDSAGGALGKISGSLGYIPANRAYVGLDLSQMDGYGGYVHNLDVRFFWIGIKAPFIGYNWCYVYDCWFFGCDLGAYGTVNSLSVSTSDFCNVGTLCSPDDIYTYDNTTCTVDRNGNGLPDTWEFQYFDSLAHSGSELDSSGHTLLYDYQHYSSFPSVTISTPANNSSITTARVNVTGTFVEPFLKQITVNGVTAFISGNTFEALNVPLNPGANTVTATIEENSVAAIVNNIAQRTATASITVNGSATPVDPVQLTATPVAGFAPLTVSFQVTSSAPGTFQQVIYDFKGNGEISQTANNLNSISHTYSSASENFPVATVVTSAGRFSSAGGWSSADPSRLSINVQAPPVLPPNTTITVTDPVDLKTTASGNLYVLSRSTATILEYNSSRTLLRSLASIGTSTSGLDVDSAGNVYVAVTGDDQVLRFTPTASSFQLDTTFGTSGHIGKDDKTSGTGNGQFNAPFDVAVSPDGTQIAVSDSGNNRIQQFTTSGTFLNSFGQQGSGIGQFNTPKGVAYDAAGYLYIVDSGNNRIALAFSDSVIGTSGSAGTGLGQFQGAVKLAVGTRGVYVAETANNRVQVFSPVTHADSMNPTPFGSRLALSSTQTGISQVQAVAEIPDLLNEKIYVADTGNNSVIMVTLPADSPVQTWNTMVSHIAASDISGAISSFSSTTAPAYRQAFNNIGTTASATQISAIGTLTPVSIGADTAQYYFEQVISGQTITFPVSFVKENGVWKIVEF